MLPQHFCTRWKVFSSPQKLGCCNMLDACNGWSDLRLVCQYVPHWNIGKIFPTRSLVAPHLEPNFKVETLFHYVVQFFIALYWYAAHWPMICNSFAFNTYLFYFALWYFTLYKEPSQSKPFVTLFRTFTILLLLSLTGHSVIFLDHGEHSCLSRP